MRPPLSIHLGESGRILVPDDAATTDECGDYVGSTGAPAARHERTALETQSFRFTIGVRYRWGGSASAGRRPLRFMGKQASHAGRSPRKRAR